MSGDWTRPTGFCTRYELNWRSKMISCHTATACKSALDYCPWHEANSTKLKSFCRKRSLLQCYGSTSLALAELSLQTGQVAGIMDLLETVSGLLARAGYIHMQMRCDKLLAKIAVASGDSRS